MPLMTPIADGPFNASPKSQALAKESHEGKYRAKLTSKVSKGIDRRNVKDMWG